MSFSNVISSSKRQQLNELAASKTSHLNRYNRCKDKFKRLSRDQIVDWLNGLDSAERELCKVVLNNLLKIRTEKREKAENEI
ncbi:MAG: hypothetical protein ACPGUD_13060 [Parashewanella sp.]